MAHDRTSEHFIEKAIYGLITVLAVLVVMEDHPPVAWRGALTLFGTTLAVALVDTYAATIARMLSQGRSLGREEVRAIWREAVPVLTGAQAPTLVLLLAAAGLFSVDRALRIAEVVALLLLFGFGLRVGQQLHQRPFGQVLSGLALLAIAALIVGIKALFH